MLFGPGLTSFQGSCLQLPKGWQHCPVLREHQSAKTAPGVGFPPGWDLEAKLPPWGLGGLPQQNPLSWEVPSYSLFLPPKRGEGQKERKTMTLMLHISQCYPRKHRNQVSRKSSQMRYDVLYDPPSAWCPYGRLLFWKSPYLGWVHGETQSQMKLKVGKMSGWVQAHGMSCTSTDYSMFPSSEKQPEHTQQILFPTHSQGLDQVILDYFWLKYHSSENCFSCNRRNPSVPGSLLEMWMSDLFIRLSWKLRGLWQS